MSGGRGGNGEGLDGKNPICFYSGKMVVVILLMLLALAAEARFGERRRPTCKNNAALGRSASRGRRESEKIAGHGPSTHACTHACQATKQRLNFFFLSF